ncbi:MAG: hypothetical protein AAF696_37035 [Bacteroidota bacterium]
MKKRTKAYLILRELADEDLIAGIMDLDELVFCNEDEEALIFKTKSEAQNFLNKEKQKGRIIKLRLSDPSD